MNETLVKINSLPTPKNTLENLRIGGTVIAPRYQRDSIKQAVARIKDQCQKRYSIKTDNDFQITIKRVR
jgi:hypothetical protein